MDPPRLLARGSALRYRTLPGGRQAIDGRERDDDSDRGYTASAARALRGEPEAVAPDVQRSLTASARRSAADRQRGEWRERKLAITREIDWLESQRFDRDVRSPLRALRRQLDRIDRLL